MLTSIRIVLVNTSHPGNIGSAARAMKTMGLKELWLVDPHEFPHPKAEELASGALDVLQNATVVKTIEEALHDCHLVVGTSARSRAIPWPMLTPRELAEKAREEQGSKIAIVFGREQSGLTNEELQQCHFHVEIPANPEYSSLNVANALQVIAYELRVASLTASTPKWDCEIASFEEVERFYEHLERVLIEIDFLKPAAPRQLMARLRRLFNRARLDTMEVNILRGILTAVQARNKKD